jgi:hypothetical protein
MPDTLKRLLLDLAVLVVVVLCWLGLGDAHSTESAPTKAERIQAMRANAAKVDACAIGCKAQCGSKF